MKNRIIYIPSLSAGAYASYLKNNREIVPGLCSRFYDEKFPEKFRYKYFLVTAGHRYKKMNYVQEHGLQNSFVFGDSGGFQIANGTLDWNLTLRDQIFNFLENNSTVAANLDIPPKIEKAGQLQE